MLLTLLIQTLVAALLALVVLGPGCVVSRALRLDRTLHPLLRPAAWLVVGVLVVAALSACTLTVGAPPWVMPLALVLLIVACGAWLIRRDGRPGMPPLPSLTAARRGRGASRHDQRRRVDMTNVDPPALAIALATACAMVAGLIRGARLDHDSLYHVAVIRKLAELNGPTWSNTQRFVDGSLNPAYALPAWHQTVAIPAVMTGIDPATLWWMLPAVMAPLAILSWAGAARMLFGTSIAAAIAAISTLLLVTFSGPQHLLMITLAAQPGEIVFLVLMPLFMTTLVGATLARAVPRVRLLAALTVLATIVLHANYVFHLGLIAAGYLIVRLLSARLRAGEVRSLALTSAMLLITTLAGLLPLLPVLRSLEHFGRGTGADVSSGLFERFGPLYAGSPDSFHLEPSVLLAPGGTALLAIPALASGWCWRGRPLGALLLGTTSLVLLVSQSDTLFMALLGIGSTTAGVRIGRILPTILGATSSLLLLAVLTRSLARRGRGWRVGGPALVATLLAVGVASVEHAYPVGSLAVEFVDDRHSRFPASVLYVTVAMVTAMIIVLAIDGHKARRMQAQRRRARDDRRRPTRGLGRGPEVPQHDLALLLALAMLVGGFGTVREASLRIADDLRDRPLSGTEVDRLGRYPRAFRETLDELPNGTVLLAPPRVSYDAMAIAPIYVVADFKTWQADTPRNDTGGRLARLERFYADGTDDDWRLSFLEQNGAEALANPSGGSSVARFLRRHVGLVDEPVPLGDGRMALYEVDREELRDLEYEEVDTRGPGQRHA